jgi:hypothetical protein
MSRKWVIALVLAALGACVAFATVVLPRWRRPAEPGGRASPLQVEENKDRVTTESGVEGQRDLCYRNRTDNPVTVRLEQKDCDCAHVLFCVAPEAWKGLDAEDLRKRAADPALVWQALEEGREGITLPHQAVGLVRLRWKAAVVGDHVFWAHLRVDEGGERGRQRLEVPVRFVEPVSISAEDNLTSKEADVGPLNAGEERAVRFLCCSTTREKFSLTPAPADDPLVRCGTPQPLTREEVRAVSDRAGTAVRAGYRVTVTVRERADDARLDMGPFRRPVVLHTNVFPGHEVRTHVNGTVRGEVWLAAAEGKGFVDLGTLSTTAPEPRVITVESRDPQLELTVDERRTLEFLRVELLDAKEGKPAGGGKSWRVRVRMRSDALFRGDFPKPMQSGYDTAVACSIVFVVARQGPAAAPVRRLYVPVRGTVKRF